MRPLFIRALLALMLCHFAGGSLAFGQSSPLVYVVDASLSTESLQIADSTVLTSARRLESTADVSLVVFDDVVQRVVSLQRVGVGQLDAMRTTLSELQSSPTSNLTTGIERGLDELKDRKGGRLIVFARAAIDAPDEERRVRYRQWLQQLLLPDAAEQGVAITLISPETGKDQSLVADFLSYPLNTADVLASEVGMVGRLLALTSADGSLPVGSGDVGPDITTAALDSAANPVDQFSPEPAVDTGAPDAAPPPETVSTVADASPTPGIPVVAPPSAEGAWSHTAIVRYLWYGASALLGLLVLAMLFSMLRNRRLENTSQTVAVGVTGQSSTYLPLHESRGRPFGSDVHGSADGTAQATPQQGVTMAATAPREALVHDTDTELPPDTSSPRGAETRFGPITDLVPGVAPRPDAAPAAADWSPARDNKPTVTHVRPPFEGGADATDARPGVVEPDVPIEPFSDADIPSMQSSPEDWGTMDAIAAWKESEVESGPEESTANSVLDPIPAERGGASKPQTIAATRDYSRLTDLDIIDNVTRTDSVDGVVRVDDDVSEPPPAGSETVSPVEASDESENALPSQDAPEDAPEDALEDTPEDAAPVVSDEDPMVGSETDTSLESNTAEPLPERADADAEGDGDVSEDAGGDTTGHDGDVPATGGDPETTDSDDSIESEAAAAPADVSPPVNEATPDTDQAARVDDIAESPRSTPADDQSMSATGDAGAGKKDSKARPTPSVKAGRAALDGLIEDDDDSDWLKLFSDRDKGSDN